MKRSPGVIERACGQMAGRLIVWTARLARKRGDTHQVRHLHAAIQAGNTGPVGHASPCPFETAPMGEGKP